MTGAGVIGLLTVWTLAKLGVVVDVVEPDAARRALAARLGARRAVVGPDQLDDAYALGLECSSRDAAFELLQARMAHDGRLCVLSDGNLEPLTLTPHFHARELSVVGSSDGWDYHAHAAWFGRTPARTRTCWRRSLAGMCGPTTCPRPSSGWQRSWGGL